MVAKKQSRPRAKSLKAKLKQDPVGTVKNEVKKTGALQVPIAAFALGMIGGGAVASQLNKIPMVGGVLSAMASKGARFTASLKR